jgi:hypothetical protein
MDLTPAERKKFRPLPAREAEPQRAAGGRAGRNR